MLTSRIVSFFFQAEDGIRHRDVTGVQTCALPISDPNSRPDETTTEGENTPAAAIEEKSYFTGVQATLGDKEGWQLDRKSVV